MANTLDNLLDQRMYRTLNVHGSSSGDMLIAPGSGLMSYAGHFYESPVAAENAANELMEKLDPASEAYRKIEKSKKWRVDALTKFRDDEERKGTYMAGISFIHPYALLRLTNAGKHASDPSGAKLNVIDDATPGNTKWYEDSPVSNPVSSSYAKNPTTGDLINWSLTDSRGRFPYMFQDFVFCKYWNRIENNRMITLRRYPAPVVDAVEPANYEDGDSMIQAVETSYEGAKVKNVPFAPLSTAVTYFGEGTGNSLKDLLSFAYQYNWEELNSDVWDTTSSQIEEGDILNGEAHWLSGGLGVIAQSIGILHDLKGVENINSKHALGLPPDPYSAGPYENRILGPVNVINNVYKRKRGLTFKHDSLTISFEYVARPIAHVNNKAIMLDLLANILAMTYSSGAFFGGAHKYRTEKPAIYPWRNTNSLNKIYQGKLFGKDSAWNDVLGDVFNESNKNWIMDFAKGITDAVKAVANDVIAAVLGTSQTEGEKSENDKAKSRGKLLIDKTFSTAGRAVAAKFLKNKQAPWLQGAKAILTGEPIGDWHLTIGNPLNPIAMIGNLIVTDSKIEFSDELGPDDFPLGFKASITLQHGMGRDKDSIESMFNKGSGRIYILPDEFVSSADSETTVDKNSGANNPYNGTFKTDGEYGILRTTGSYDVKGYVSELSTAKDGRVNMGKYVPLSTSNSKNAPLVLNSYKTQAWAMHQIL